MSGDKIERATSSTVAQPSNVHANAHTNPLLPSTDKYIYIFYTLARIVKQWRDIIDQLLIILSDPCHSFCIPVTTAYL